MFCQNKNCKFHHNICSNKLTCIDKTCELGHDVCYDKRRLINKIYNLYKNNNNDNLCNYYITCYDKNCKLNHQLNYKYRNIIYNIIISANIQVALDYYHKNIEFGIEDELISLIDETEQITTLKNNKEIIKNNMFKYAVYLNELVDKMQLLYIEYENCKKLIINEENKLLEINLKLNNLE